MIGSEDAARDYVASLCDASAMARLDRLVTALGEENQRQNLIARATLSSVWQRHIADSAQLLEFVPHGTPLWLDLGSGAGMPGLIIAAMRPNWPVMLVESRRKRIDWLQRMRSEFELDQCRVAGARLENVETTRADIISARAFAPLKRILTLSARFSTSETLWLLPKGRSAAQELQELPKRQRALFHVEQSRTDSESGIVVGRLAGRKGP